MLGVYVPPQFGPARGEVTRRFQNLLEARGALLDNVDMWHRAIVGQLQVSRRKDSQSPE